MQNGVAVLASGASGADANYTVKIPAGASNLVISTSGGTGDSDLYTKFGSVPTSSSYDCRPYKTGNAESCTVATPQAGTYYVRVHGYQSFSNVSVKASWTAGGGGDGGGSVFTNTTNINVPDSGTATSTVNVTRTGIGSTSTKIGVKIVHPFRGDLRVTIIAPSGGSLVLMSGAGTSFSGPMNSIISAV